ncbi:MAG: Gmad2 immunoglobulin-like domain-containing protein [Patescibacteria group bacterium]
MKKILFGGTLLFLVFILSACGSGANKNANPAFWGCSEEAKICPDGSTVFRQGENCEFAACPKQDMIVVSAPVSGEIISSPLEIKGEARGSWFFEASFVVQLRDAKDNLLGQAVATASGDWMTEDFVPFSATLNFSLGTDKEGTLVFIKNNPSGLPENSAEFSLPVSFGPLSDTPLEFLDLGPEELSVPSSAPQNQAVKIYYYNALLDQDEAGNLKCSSAGLSSVNREISPSENPIEDTINLLINGGLTPAEIEAGLSTEFPLSGFTLESAELDNGLLSLTFSDPENTTVGGSCRVNVLRSQIEETAKQFPEVARVQILPLNLFQP